MRKESFSKLYYNHINNNLHIFLFFRRDRKKIVMNYFRNGFLNDILVQIPLFFAYYIDENSS